MGEARVVDVDRRDREILPARRGSPDDVHQTHWAGGPDDAHAIAGANLAVGRDRRRSSRPRTRPSPGPAGEVVVDAADVHRHGTPNRDAAGDDVYQAPERQAILQSLDRGGVGAEVDDVVEPLARDVGEAGDTRPLRVPIDRAPRDASARSAVTGPAAPVRSKPARQSHLARRIRHDDHRPPGMRSLARSRHT